MLKINSPSGKSKLEPQYEPTTQPPECIGKENWNSYNAGGCVNWYKKVRKLFDTIY